MPSGPRVTGLYAASALDVGASTYSHQIWLPKRLSFTTLNRFRLELFARKHTDINKDMLYNIRKYLKI